MAKTTFEQWRMFKAVVDHGGFNQAAEAIHKSQSSVHHAVRKLEEQLGIELFEVHGRKTILTPHGELLLSRGNYLLDELSRVEAVAESLSNGVESSLVIAVDEAFPHEIIYKVMENVSAKFPLLKIELLETVLSGSNDLIERNEAALGISPIAIADGLNEELMRVQFIAVAAHNHPLLAMNRELTANDLKTCRQIVVRDSALARKASAGWLGSEQRWTVSHVRTSLDLVSKGFGFAWLPEPLVQPYLEIGELKELPLAQGRQRSIAFYLNYAELDTLGPAAREFMGELRVQTMPYTKADLCE
ncbi:LysR family transcriptional regulator [Porticoccaceae bacterium LTM1]|nr:LysR family transcriptional regulator [Porticoccaceae bacterium LTM1]